jgi:hypothetical protein
MTPQELEDRLIDFAVISIFVSSTRTADGGLILPNQKSTIVTHQSSIDRARVAACVSGIW